MGKVTGTWALEQGQSQSQRLHHYIFDVDAKGLDISGFIIQTEKKRGKRHSFRVFLDSNDNAEFDKTDQLIGKKRLHEKSSVNGIGGLLEPREVGQLDIDFKQNSSSFITRFRFFKNTDKKIASLRNKTAILSSPTSMADSMSFSTLGSSSPFDDDEWRQSWEKYCGRDAKPPYPEDCFFYLFNRPI